MTAYLAFGSRSAARLDGSPQAACPSNPASQSHRLSAPATDMLVKPVFAEGPLLCNHSQDLCHGQLPANCDGEEMQLSKLLGVISVEYEQHLKLRLERLFYYVADLFDWEFFCQPPALHSREAPIHNFAMSSTMSSTMTSFYLFRPQSPNDIRPPLCDRATYTPNYG
ncbi:hypothetical protein GX51_04373 [Blastomyces parvus]|uniref:Uncharacterized protein n=1 Tax=Blastomyces parvus TaxID=2060905 RepID=A0A2B7X2C7_9EURO|nr:hypothetical protein GX51_04373 [Blastomyces parvus]